MCLAQLNLTLLLNVRTAIKMDDSIHSGSTHYVLGALLNYWQNDCILQYTVFYTGADEIQPGSSNCSLEHLKNNVKRDVLNRRSCEMPRKKGQLMLKVKQIIRRSKETTNNKISS